MIHVTCRLTAKNRDQLRNPTLGNGVLATFTFFNQMALNKITLGCQSRTLLCRALTLCVCVCACVRACVRVCVCLCVYQIMGKVDPHNDKDRKISHKFAQMYLRQVAISISNTCKCKKTFSVPSQYLISQS